MGSFLNAVLPLLMTLLVSMGGLNSAAILHPAMLGALFFVLNFMETVIFPLIYFNAIINLSGSIAGIFNLNKLAGLFKDIALGAMAIMLSLFVGFLGLMGVAGFTLDGLAAKAVKTAAGVFIPIIGRTVADIMDSVAGTALLLKNAVGIIGALILLSLCAAPAVKILGQFLIFRLAAAIIQPLGEERLADALYGISTSLLLLFAAAAVCGLIFFFILALAVGVGNISLMLR
jgi:stage III sporulation protein AE